MGIPSVLFGLLLSGWIAFIPGAMAGHADFRQLYAAGHIVRSGMTRQLYDYDVQKEFQDRFVSPEAIALPFIRPAYQAVLFVPFTFLSYRTSYWVMLGINIGLLTLSFQLLSPYLLNLRVIFADGRGIHTGTRLNSLVDAIRRGACRFVERKRIRCGSFDRCRAIQVPIGHSGRAPASYLAPLAVLCRVRFHGGDADLLFHLAHRDRADWPLHSLCPVHGD